MLSSEYEIFQGTHYALGASGKIVEIGNIFPSDRYALGPFKCIECGCEMVPHKGRVRAHHFKHHGPRTPACTDETYLHFLAKTALYEAIRDATANGTPYNVKFERPLICNRYAEEFGQTCESESAIETWDVTRSFDKVELETCHDAFIPDVLLSSSKSEDVIFLEIKVTHGCEEEKIRSGIRIIEVEVSGKDDIDRLRRGISLYNERTKTYGLKELKPRQMRCQKTCSATGTAFVAYARGKTIVKTGSLEELRKTRSLHATKFFKYIGSDVFIAPRDVTSIYFENSVVARFEKAVDVRSCLLCRKGGLGKYEKAIYCFEKGIETEINTAHACKFYTPVANEAEARSRFERNARYLERSGFGLMSPTSEGWSTSDNDQVFED